MVEVTPLRGTFAARIDGFDPSDIDAVTTQTLNQAWLQFAVLHFPRLRLASSALLRLARIFGEVRPQPLQRKEYLVPEHPELRVVSSEHRDTFGDGLPLRTGGSWHTDHSQLHHPPSGTILSAITIPASGGDTRFCDQRAAYAELSSERKAAVSNLVGEHVYNSRYSPRRLQKLRAGEVADQAPALHPLVRVHPQNGRTVLYFNPIRIERFVGQNEETSQRLIEELTRHCEQEAFVYRHRWSEGDVLLWDNRQVMHMVDHDYPKGALRVMHRALIYTGHEWQ
ncbi:MAG: TauD/TfdA family dioxygenase [Pseudomonadota bacterium]